MSATDDAGAVGFWGIVAENPVLAGVGLVLGTIAAMVVTRAGGDAARADIWNICRHDTFENGPTFWCAKSVVTKTRPLADAPAWYTVPEMLQRFLECIENRGANHDDDPDQDLPPTSTTDRSTSVTRTTVCVVLASMALALTSCNRPNPSGSARAEARSILLAVDTMLIESGWPNVGEDQDEQRQFMAAVESALRRSHGRFALNPDVSVWTESRSSLGETMLLRLGDADTKGRFWGIAANGTVVPFDAPPPSDWSFERHLPAFDETVRFLDGDTIEIEANLENVKFRGDYVVIPYRDRDTICLSLYRLHAVKYETTDQVKTCGRPPMDKAYTTIRIARSDIRWPPISPADTSEDTD